MEGREGKVLLQAMKELAEQGIVPYPQVNLPVCSE